MKYKKYVYAIHRVSTDKIVGLFSSEKRLFEWAELNNIDVYNERFGKIKYESFFHQPGYRIIGGRKITFDYIPVRIPLDETCKYLTKDFLQ